MRLCKVPKLPQLKSERYKCGCGAIVEITDDDILMAKTDELGHPSICCPFCGHGFYGIHMTKQYHRCRNYRIIYKNFCRLCGYHWMSKEENKYIDIFMPEYRGNKENDNNESN